jgi:hypothetical protein
VSQLNVSDIVEHFDQVVLTFCRFCLDPALKGFPALVSRELGALTGAGFDKLAPELAASKQSAVCEGLLRKTVAAPARRGSGARRIRPCA